MSPGNRSLAIIRLFLSDTMKKTFFLCLFVGCSLLALAQEQSRARAAYEYYHEIPTYIDSLQASLRYPMAWGNDPERDFATWKTKARAQVFACMQQPAPAANDYDMQVIAEEKRDGYVARKVSIALSRWYHVSAYLLIPDGKGPHPAVNLMHDHGAHFFIGKEKMIRPIAAAEDTAVVNDAQRWVENLYEGQFLGDYLARNGYVVFSADAPLWGERGRKEGVSRAKYDIIAGNMMMLGRNLCGMMHYDDVATTEFLASLPEVDSTRIGTAGCSMGAYRAWMLAALSDRVKVACAVCWMVTTEAQLSLKYGRKENGGFANCIPGIRNYLDYPDIASLACPKPMLFISGKRDKLFPIPGVEDAFAKMGQVWTSQQVADKLDTRIIDQGHECNLANQAAILSFLQRWL